MDTSSYFMDRQEWLEIPYEKRLKIVGFIFDKLTSGGCSFRKLIEERLGFTNDAYCPLYMAGGDDVAYAMKEYLYDDTRGDE